MGLTGVISWGAKLGEGEDVVASLKFCLRSRDEGKEEELAGAKRTFGEDEIVSRTGV